MLLFFFYSKRTAFPFFEETDRLNFLSFSKYAHPTLKIISSLVISFLLLLHNPCMNIHGPCLPYIISFICWFFSVLLNTKMLLNVLIYTPPSWQILFLFVFMYDMLLDYYFPDLNTRRMCMECGWTHFRSQTWLSMSAKTLGLLFCLQCTPDSRSQNDFSSQALFFQTEMF